MSNEEETLTEKRIKPSASTLAKPLTSPARIVVPRIVKQIPPPKPTQPLPIVKPLPRRDFIKYAAIASFPDSFFSLTIFNTTYFLSL
ncbi:MAG: hypothetical protein QXX95_01280 [Nitrososphaerales archaeon]